MNTSAFSTERVDRIFNDTTSANGYFDHLVNLGYSTEEITVIMSEKTKDKFYASNSHIEKNSDEALKGAGAGGAIGGTVGAIAAAITAVGSNFLIPGLGFVIAGPLAAALVGAGIGGAGGALAGALAKIGLSDSVSVEYIKSIEEGKIIISVEPKNDDHHTSLSAFDNVVYSKKSKVLNT